MFVGNSTKKPVYRALTAGSLSRLFCFLVTPSLEGNSLSGFSGSIVAGYEFIGGDEMDDNSATGKNGQPNYIFLYFVVSGLVATAFY